MRGRRLEGLVALVTDGSAGIGRAYYRRLAEDGARVVIADVAAADETVRAVEAVGGEALGLTCDVSSGEQVQAAVAAAIDRFGSVYVLVHNAAIYPFVS